MTPGGDPHDPVDPQDQDCPHDPDRSHDPDEPLGAQVWALFRALDHAGDPPTPAPAPAPAPVSTAAAAAAAMWRTGEAGCERDGTRVRFALHLDGRRVIAARYRAYGCPHTLAVCEWLARRLSGCELAELSAAGLAQAIGDPLTWGHRLAVPAAKLGRLLVIEDALRAALGSAGADVTRFDPVVTKGA